MSRATKAKKNGRSTWRLASATALDRFLDNPLRNLRVLGVADSACIVWSRITLARNEQWFYAATHHCQGIQLIPSAATTTRANARVTHQSHK
mmetsp:Transcript_6566/g.13724  ORF Transcript_6566/g.13724 Transcript_6566/m.13724 type:complete len:92 (+) Transcript_6566:2069-2344(+)